MESLESILVQFESADLRVTKKIQDNSYNAVYKVEGRDMRYALRIGRRGSAQDTESELYLLEHLTQAGLPVPTAVVARSGMRYVRTETGETAVLLKWIEGKARTVAAGNKLSRNNVVDAGRMLAKIHQAGKAGGASITTNRSLISEIQRAISLRKEIESFYDGGAGFVDECERQAAFASAAGEDRTFLHNDYRPQNVLYLEDGTLSGVIDFDWYCVGPAAKDLAHSLVEWSFPDGAAGYDLENLQAFLEGYNAVSGRRYQLDDSLKRWMYFSAISDAATYFSDTVLEAASSGGTAREKQQLRSYMYKKARMSLDL